MKSSLPTTFFTLSSCLLSLSDATGTFRMDIARQLPSSTSRSLRRRSSSPVSETLTNELTMYVANVTIGTPGQTISLQLDTGSSDLWVPTPQSSACLNVTAGGCPLGSFDPTNSSTFTVIAKGAFLISYVDGTGTSGDYFVDTLTVGGSTLDNFTMGLGSNDSTVFNGLIGVGYDTNEAIVDEALQANETIAPYPNFIDAMVNAGHVSSKAYSLWLNDINAGTGSILFGGIDTSKYSGDLVMMDTLLTPGFTNHTDFNVAWTSLSVSSSSGTDILTNSEFPMLAVLDSGTTITYFPADLAALIFEEFGVTDDGFVPCSLAERNGTVNYGFGAEGGPIIKVPISQLVHTGPDGNSAVFPSGIYAGQPLCEFGIAPADPGNPILFGDTFLRSAYVVYDLSNNQIAIAQTVFNSTAPSNVVPFASSGAPIPSAKTLSVQSTAMATAIVTTVPTVLPSLSAEAGFTSATPTTTSGSSNPGASGKSGAGSVVFSGIGISLTALLSAWLVL